jgi:hypothetical protein
MRLSTIVSDGERCLFNGRNSSLVNVGGAGGLPKTKYMYLFTRRQGRIKRTLHLYIARREVYQRRHNRGSRLTEITINLNYSQH